MAAERITRETVNHKLWELRPFLLTQNTANYTPEQHHVWVDRWCMPGIRRGDYRAYVWRNAAAIVGDAVVRIGDKKSTLAIRNFYIAEGQRGYGLGGALLAQVLDDALAFLRSRKAVAPHATHITIQTDVAAGSPDEVFFERMGFDAVEAANLYDPHKLDVMMERIIET